MSFSLYGNDEAPKFEVGVRVKRTSDGKAGIITSTTIPIKGQPRQVEVKWDSSGSKSTRPIEGLSIE